MRAFACNGLAWAMRSGPTLFSRLYAMPWYRDELQAWASSDLERDTQLLELGCASGELSAHLHGLRAEVTAVDKSPAMLARAACLDAGMLPIALPIALGIGLDPSFRAPMAIVVICGLVACTFLSLLVTPVLFSCVDDAMQKCAALFTNLLSRPVKPASALFPGSE